MAIFFSGLISLFFISCEKSDPKTGIEDQNQADLAAYFPLSIGSFWVYQNVDIDPHGQEKVRTETDRIIISRDTLIQDKLHYVFEGNSYPSNGEKVGITDIMRDSAGYIVNQYGDVKFSHSKFTDMLHRNREVYQDEVLFTLSYIMEDENISVNVPAGNFRVINFKGTVMSEKEMEGIPNPRYINTLYARGAGNPLI